MPISKVFKDSSDFASQFGIAIRGYLGESIQEWTVKNL